MWDPVRELPEEGGEGIDRTLRNRTTQAAVVREGTPDPQSGVREDILKGGLWLRPDE